LSNEMTEDKVRALVKEAAGVEAAEIRDAVNALHDDLVKRYGSVDVAKASGENVDFAEREGLTQRKTALGDQKAHWVDGRAKGVKGEQSDFGRMVTDLARAGGNVKAAQAKAEAAGDVRSAELFKELNEHTRQKAQLFSDFGSGGALVPEAVSEDVIDLVYPRASFMELGATLLPMPEGQLTLPYIDSGVTASYIGEAANAPKSEQAYGQLQLNAKKLAVVVPVSNDLLRTPSARVDAYIQKNISNHFRVKMESEFLAGTGASGTPKGLYNWIPTANKFNQGGTAVANKVSDLLKLQRLVVGADIDIDNGGYVMSHRTEYGLKGTLDGNNNFLFLREMEMGMLLGFRYKATSNVADTYSTDKSRVYFASFGHIVIGDTMSVEIKVAPDAAYYDGSAVQSGLSTDVTPIRAIARHDMVPTRRGAEAACLEAVSWA
jgi:HK97 family phage major capsid protein